MTITRGCTGMRSYLNPAKEIFLRGWFKEATTGYEPKNPQAYPHLFRWEGKNFTRRGLMGKVWQKHCWQVQLLELETPVEQELLVAPHGNLNVEMQNHSDREDGSCAHTGGIGVVEDLSHDAVQKSHEERKKVMCHDTSRGSHTISSWPDSAMQVDSNMFSSGEASSASRSIKDLLELKSQDFSCKILLATIPPSPLKLKVSHTRLGVL
ncbi:hypothetical protein H6P81_002657 [Aristolochia fimbriata]|uniref:Uncharacterized protein n=1 Tax=Aristolochia fimbriata TaxID=158543 RepID=A0AAV7FC20_ARIFI|nr:hypothetical protein H6P81_002657 [Aristolochia fimbriata]